MPPAVAGDRDEFLERRRQLLLARPGESLAEDRDQIRARPAVHEDDEPKSELLLVVTVQPTELGGDLGLGLLPLLPGRPVGEAPGSDGRVRVYCLDFLGLRQPGDHSFGATERIVGLGEALRESGPSLEELHELIYGQLPR